MVEENESWVAGLRSVKARIAQAACDCGRSPDEIALVAVSKTVPTERIAPLIVAGQRVFGENRVQEAAGKFPALIARHGPLELHLIGPLQTNKAREAVHLFDVIQTLDRPRLAEVLAAEMARAGKSPRLFVQVNTGEEAQKAGIAPSETEAFVALCRERFGLRIAGLMCIPPAQDPPSPHFALLAKLARACGLACLSMGMSADYEAAIQLGATHVRVGSAVFGARAGPVAQSDQVIER